MPYLAQLLSGYRHGLACDLRNQARPYAPLWPTRTIQLGEARSSDSSAQSLVRQDRQLPKIDESNVYATIVTQPSPSIPRSMGLSAA